jgi:hypothetical protein
MILNQTNSIVTRRFKKDQLLDLYIQKKTFYLKSI